MAGGGEVGPLGKVPHNPPAGVFHFVLEDGILMRRTPLFCHPSGGPATSSSLQEQLASLSSYNDTRTQHLKDSVAPAAPLPSPPPPSPGPEGGQRAGEPEP